MLVLVTWLSTFWLWSTNAAWDQDTTSSATSVNDSANADSWIARPLSENRSDGGAALRATPAASAAELAALGCPCGCASPRT